MKQMENMKI